MKKQMKFLTLAAMVAIVGQSAMAMPAPSGFTDVDYDSEYYAAASYLRENGVINGYENGTYRPNLTINRAEFTKILIKTTKNPEDMDSNAILEVTPNQNCFTDVHEEWFAQYVCEAKNMGIVKGYSDGTFRPSEDISFVEAAKIITKAKYGLNEGSNGEAWYKNYVNYMATNAAIPVSINELNKKITRGEMAEMIYRLDEGILTKDTMHYNGDGKLTPPSCLSMKYTGLTVNVKTFDNRNIPDASILVNGENVDLKSLKDGTYEITVSKDGYETYTQEVTVNYSGQTGCPSQESVTIFLQSNEEVALFEAASAYCEDVKGGSVQKGMPIDGWGMPDRNEIDYECQYFIQDNGGGMGDTQWTDLYELYYDNTFTYDDLDYGFRIFLPAEMKDLEITETKNNEDAAITEEKRIEFKNDDDTHLTLYVYNADEYDEYISSLDGLSSLGDEIYRHQRANLVIGYSTPGCAGAVIDIKNKELQDKLTSWFGCSTENHKYTVREIDLEY